MYQNTLEAIFSTCWITNHRKPILGSIMVNLLSLVKILLIMMNNSFHSMTLVRVHSNKTKKCINTLIKI